MLEVKLCQDREAPSHLNNGVNAGILLLDRKLLYHGNFPMGPLRMENVIYGLDI